jgi:hypothetical protein
MMGGVCTEEQKFVSRGTRECHDVIVGMSKGFQDVEGAIVKPIDGPQAAHGQLGVVEIQFDDFAAIERVLNSYRIRIFGIARI